MEGHHVYEDSYKHLDSIQKQNVGGRVTIDYTKLDTKSAEAIRSAINEAVRKRKPEVYQVVFGSSGTL